MSLSSVTSTGLSGLRASETMLDVTANNLANLQTPGFKQSEVVFATQPAVGSGGLQVGTGVRAVAIASDPSSGALVPAAGSLQLAIEGEGYFVLADAQGQRLYTRDGTFHVNADGELVTPAGQRVLGWQSERGVFQAELVPLFILSGPQRDRNLAGQAQSLTMRLQVGTNGRLELRLPDGTVQMIGDLRIARFANPNGLRAVGQNAFAVTGASGPPWIGPPGRDGRGTIRASATELSNVDVGTNLITMSRATLLFRANLEVLDVADQLARDLLELRRS